MATRQPDNTAVVDSYRDPRTTPAPGQRLSELRYLILAAQREGNRLLAQLLRPLGLTPAQAEIITVLAEHEGLTLAGLSRYVVCETGSPSRLVDTLVRRGLVERESGRLDRRVVHLYLTQAGREIAARINECDRRFNAMYEDMIGKHDLATVIRTLQRLLETTISGAKVARRFGSGDWRAAARSGRDLGDPGQHAVEEPG